MSKLELLRLGGRVYVPSNCQAILWDMDGVLIDSLSHSLLVCNTLVQDYFKRKDVVLEDEFIRSIFAYDTIKFWNIILEHISVEFKIKNATLLFDSIHNDYIHKRKKVSFALNKGIVEILQSAKSNNLKMAVVSNNLNQDIKKILSNVGILDYFDIIVGNDHEKLNKKPAPDTYLHASKLLNVETNNCVVIEDSLIGAEAGKQANMYTVGVSTGGVAFDCLSPNVDMCYSSFEELICLTKFGDVKNKRIITPNDFVSHMVEHIAWRLCIEITLFWNNNNWFKLGEVIGVEISKNESFQNSAAALGMIDDGSAEISIKGKQSEGRVSITSVDNIDIDWFLSLRCEQISSGNVLIEFLEGFASGLYAQIDIKICSINDPHHTWEGVFRSIGIALNKIYTPRIESQLPEDVSNSLYADDMLSHREIRTLERDLYSSTVVRGTAESYVSVKVDFRNLEDNKFNFNVAKNINVTELHKLLNILARAAGFSIDVNFNATILNSSHVVLEDTALVLGKALLEILTLRMQMWGVNGAGSSIDALENIESRPIHVGISVEGRKFWVFVPFNVSIDTLRKEFLIGQNVYASLRSEDLDDFIDGLAGGLSCSIIIHIHEMMDSDSGWKYIFQGLGESIKELFMPNPYRKGVPPGVKATLA